VAGIYLHIPFCRQACTYCNFHFTTSLRYKNDLVTALCKEIELQRNFLANEPIHTIYFGGGTPSLLTIEELNAVLQHLHAYFDIAPGAEVTLEANPDNMDMGVLKSWQDVGINRLSIGIQSFFEEELRWMNRAHNADQAYRCIEDARAAGFDNFSIDLIYGSPLLTDDMWQQNMETAVGYNIPHLSCYALTVEEKTPLHKQITLHKTPDVESDKQARQFLQLMQRLRAVGYEHYEVSNFAKPHFRSKHNSSYWQGIPYLGLGPSAHSYNGTTRQWNIANNTKYIQAIDNGAVPAETEVLTDIQKLNEYLMIALRTQEGLDLKRLEQAWGFEKVQAVLKKADRYLKAKTLRQKNNSLQLTDEGMLLADGIAADLFF
jgi:oxygen-independent coproporphyrinogen III oxidase